MPLAIHDTRELVDLDVLTRLECLTIGSFLTYHLDWHRWVESVYNLPSFSYESVCIPPFLVMTLDNPPSF